MTNFASFMLLACVAAFSLTARAQTWSSQPSGTALNLLSVAATSPTTAYTVGQNGTARKTTDGGATWSNMASGTTEELNSIRFLNATTGFTFGGGQEVRRTTNGGSTWSQISFGSTTLHDGFYTSANQGWVVGDVEAGYGFLYNPGTFNFPFVAAAANRSLRGIYFVNGTTGWVVGQGGVVLKTVNAGSSWQAQTSGVSQTLESVMFGSPTVGVAVGDGGTIIRTDNAGTTWQTVLSGTPHDLKAVYFSDATSVWAVGDLGTILHSTDAGLTWTPEVSGTLVPLQGIHGSGTAAIWTVGDNGTILMRASATGRPTTMEAAAVITFPQPAREVVYLQLPAAADQLKIYNALGAEVRTQPALSGNLTEIKRNGLPAGLYTYSVFSQSNLLTKGRLLFE